jgi:hypothetical protein
VLDKLPQILKIVKNKVSRMAQRTSDFNLSVDEREAIYPKPKESIYYLMNQYLRNQDRRSLIPFLKYLKLLLSALYKLPPVKGKVCRGVKANMAELKSKEHEEITWNGFSSTTLNSKTLDNPMFLGNTGKRTVFFIDCKTGRNISAFSALKKEQEILLLPCTSFMVEHVVVNGDFTIVQLTETEPLEDFADLFI